MTLDLKKDYISRDKENELIITKSQFGIFLLIILYVVFLIIMEKTTSQKLALVKKNNR